MIQLTAIIERNDDAFFTKCYLVKYLIKISFKTVSVLEETEAVELRRKYQI